MVTRPSVGAFGVAATALVGYENGRSDRETAPRDSQPYNESAALAGLDLGARGYSYAMGLVVSLILIAVAQSWFGA